MSTQSRVLASRANGARSRGPVTPEGLARCRTANLRHGLCSPRVVLENESEEDFRALRETCLAAYRPETPIERALVEELAAARWRLERLYSFQDALIEAEMERSAPEVEKEFKNCDITIRLALAFRTLSDNGSLNGLSRHEAHLTRTRNRIEDALLRARNQKVQDGPSPVDGRLRFAGERIDDPLLGIDNQKVQDGPRSVCQEPVNPAQSLEMTALPAVREAAPPAAAPAHRRSVPCRHHPAGPASVNPQPRKPPPRNRYNCLETR